MFDHGGNGRIAEALTTSAFPAGPNGQPIESSQLGSGLVDQSQKMTVAAMQMAEKKVWAQRS
jgi:hypothetical protein